MGLAASQARLLFITSRQNDVSAQMQRISNQNMILARDEDEVSTKYNKMLSATTLQAADGVDISYDSLMGASGAVNGLTSANVLLNSAGKVALSASDIAKYGLAEAGNAGDITSKYPDAKSFIKAVTGSDEIAAAADSSDKPAAAGASTALSGKMSINDLLGKVATGTGEVTNGFINTIYDNKVFRYAVGGVTGSEFDDLANNNSAINVFNESSNGITAYFALSDSLPTYDQKKHASNRRITDIGKKTVSISDLYNNAGNMSSSIMLGSAMRASATALPDLTAIKSNLNNLTNTIGAQLLTALSDLGFDAEAAKKAVTTSVGKYNKSYASNIYWDEGKGDGDVYDKSAKWAEARKSAFAYAQKQGDYGSGWSDVFDDANQKYNEGAVAIGVMAATGLHGIVATRCSEQGDNSWQFTLNLGNLVQDIVNDLMNTMSGGAIYDEDWSTNKVINKEKIVDVKLTAVKSSGGSSAPAKTDATNESIASYYTSIYNALKNKGWATDTLVTDKTKLTEALKNGSYTIYANGTTSNAKNSGLFTEVSDSDAKSKAEHYYEDEMRKINRKEKQLDTELTKLQTEYSGLTNDYESVKSIITANVQKSFTYCQNG